MTWRVPLVSSLPGSCLRCPGCVETPPLPRVPAPSLLLPPATSLIPGLSVPACRHAGLMAGLMGTAMHRCPSCVAVPVGLYRGGEGLLQLSEVKTALPFLFPPVSKMADAA